MITSVEAARLLKNEYPKRKIVEAAVYNSKYYLFIALEDISKPDPNDPCFLVDMKSGKIIQISPTMDIQKYSDALLNHRIEVPKL